MLRSNPYSTYTMSNGASVLHSHVSTMCIAMLAVCFESSYGLAQFECSSVAARVSADGCTHRGASHRPACNPQGCHRPCARHGGAATGEEGSCTSTDTHQVHAAGMLSCSTESRVCLSVGISLHKFGPINTNLTILFVTEAQAMSVVVLFQTQTLGTRAPVLACLAAVLVTASLCCAVPCCGVMLQGPACCSSRCTDGALQTAAG